MYKIKTILILIASIGFLTSCELDEFDEPTSELYGSIIDEATGELVGQDIIRGGELELREYGYDPVSPQFMNYKVDGTFRDSKLFASTYSVLPIKTNFFPLDTLEVNIKGKTKLDLMVTPYIRVKNVNISKTGNIITATFSLEQTGGSNVKKIGLYAGADANVGEPMRIVKAEQDINAVVNSGTVYTLSINADNEQDLKSGNLYFFRVGALYDASEAKYNYATAVGIDL